jgi:hypothetical protein
MSKQTYIALVALNVYHKMVRPGDTVELTEDEAAEVLACGAVTTQAAIDAAAQAKDEVAEHQFAKAAAAVQAPAKAAAAPAAKAAGK